MSRLAKDEDDHPEAARKHLEDARVLRRAERLDGAAYHSGYVVECALKAVLLHDRSFDAATGTTNPEQLATWHRKLRKQPFGHDLVALVNAALGAEGARYLPPITKSPCSAGASRCATTQRARSTRSRPMRTWRAPSWPPGRSSR